VFEQLSARFIPIFTRILLAVLIVSSIIAAVSLGLAPLPTLRNVDPTAVKTIAVSSVATFGALLPFAVAVSQRMRPSTSGPRLVAALLVFALAGLAHAIVLSPLLATLVQAVCSFIGMLAAGFLTVAQIAQIQRAMQSRHAESKL
jgi:hypothetical protein